MLANPASEYYVKAIGAFNLLILLFCTASYAFFVTFPQYWLKWWTESQGQYTWFYVAGYIVLALISWTSTNGTIW